MSYELIEMLIYATIRAATPLFIAGLGILLLEKAGVLNLGQEGILSLGAVIAFIAYLKTDSYVMAIFFAALSGIFLILIFAFLVLVCKASQIVSGLALSIFGVGLSIFISAPYIGDSIVGMSPINIPLLTSLPIIGKLIFGHDVIVYLSPCLALTIYFVLYKTRFGMIVRCIGENPMSAHTLGYSPSRVRLIVLLVSGAIVAVAGAYLSLAYTPILSDGLSSGRGWIALSLVVFASRLIFRLGLGALLFGLMSILHLVLQGAEVSISGNPLLINGSLLAMMPYVMTILVLVLMSIGDRRNASIDEPKSLGKNFSVSR